MRWFAQVMYAALVWNFERRARRFETDGGSAGRTNQHLETGEQGETLAYWHLRRSGYIVVARNRRPRSGRGELDIVAWDGPVLAFAEVKTRGGNEAGGPEQSVTPAQQHRIAAGAQDYLKRLRRKPAAYRFDIVSVLWDSKSGYQIKVVKDAFRD